MGLFGDHNQLVGMHVVDAHTRTLANGTEVFVGEHLRWDRGRQGPRAPAVRVPDPAEEGQLGLFRTARAG
jgi:hypothetical protein